MKSRKFLFTPIFILLIVFSSTQAFILKEKASSNTQPITSEAHGLKYSFEQLDNTKGLSNSSVNCIFQDSQNLLWIGTWDGLNRYDGNNFKIFRPEPNNENSISNQVVLKIGEDNKGDIWVLTMHGINRYSKKDNKFKRYYFARKDKAALSESQFNLAFNHSKYVYCAVKDWGIGFFDGNGFQLLENAKFSNKSIKKIDFLGDNELYVLFDDNEFNTFLIKELSSGKKAISQTDFVSGNIKTFQILPTKKVLLISTSGNTTLYTPATKEKQVLNTDGIDDIIGQFSQGVILAGKKQCIIDNNGNTMSLPWSKYLENHKVTTLIQGNENILWAGTDGDGLFKIYPIKKSFHLVSPTQIPDLSGGIIRAFLKTNNSFLVGTKGKGLFVLPPDFYLHTQYKNYKNYNANNSSVDNSVFSLCKGRNNLAYIGSDGPGLTVYDLDKSKLIGWNSIEGHRNCDYFKSVYSIYEDHNGVLWLGTNGYGMIKCKIIRSGTKLKITDFKRFTATPDNTGTGLSSNIIFSILPHNENQLWIGTRLGGLNLFDIPTSKFTVFKNVPGKKNSLSNNDILCLAKDSLNRLWVGTSFGLNLVKELKSNGQLIFKSYTVADGLPNNTIHGVVPDKNSNLWISTNFGLSNFVTRSNKFINYTKNEGLQNNEFADGAFYHDLHTGYIFMGGIKGFNYFLPGKIKESFVIPDLLIDKITGQNKAAPYYQGLLISPNSKSHPSIKLDHNQNFIDIHLGVVTYTNNEKCQYSYQLKGFDAQWNNIGNRSVISLTNIPPGKYSLWMKWSNSDGIWSSPVHAIDITIAPVWWQSDLAILIYIILAVLFILFVRSYYLKRQSLRHNIIIRKNEEQIHENRLSFFTNVAHEFLTPLTLIAGPAQKLSESVNLNEKNRKYMDMIQRNTSRLLFLTQQLLEFRKAEDDYLENTIRNFDLINLVEQIAELFDDWALDKHINYNIILPSALDGWFDKDKIEKILFNLLSNAFKYTPQNGSINVKCEIIETTYKTLSITVTNTGKGIPKDKISSLFNRFSLFDLKDASDTEMFRTGIGLAYVKKLTTVLRGEVEVKSEPNIDTSFTILIPCEKAAFHEKEIDLESAPVLISHHLKNILEQKVPVEKEPMKISVLDELENNKKKILIVEDESEIHTYLNELLAENYNIISASNGAEAFEILENTVPDLIISDVMMPIMDGVELCKKVKTDLRTCHIPFIMLTAKNSILHRIEGLESGANSYIPKPFYPEHLLVRIQKLLEEKELILKHFAQDTLTDTLATLPIDKNEKQFIRAVIELIKNNIDNEKLDIGYLEKALSISSSQLYRKTKETFNLSPGDLIRTMRLKHAAELLRKDIFTVSEVCYKSGFNNRSYFYREFNKVYNTTPKNYQLQHRLRSESFTNR